MYKQMVEPLLDHFTVVGMEARPLWPGADMSQVRRWGDLSQDLVRLLDENGWQGVHVIGHSLGAAHILFSALDRPELYDKIVLLEPPIVDQWIFNVTKILPMPILKKVAPPVRVALNRTTHWPSDQAFFDYIRPKSVFKGFPDEILWEYVNSGHFSVEGGVELRYSKEWEAHIYAALQSPWRTLKKMHHPTLAIRGAQSDTVSKRSWRKWQQTQKNTEFAEISGGGHLIPFEQPKAVGERILKYLMEA